MIRRGEEEEEEEGFDPTMSLLSSHPSSPSAPYSFLDFEYEDAFKYICFPPSPPSPPLSPLWYHPENTIPTKVNVNDLPQLPSSMPLNLLWQKYFFEEFTVHSESHHSFSRYEKAIITLFRGLPRINDSVNKLTRFKLSTYKALSPTSEAEENRWIHLNAIRSMMQNMSLSSSVSVKIPIKKDSIPGILQLENEVNMCIENNIPSFIGPTEVIHSAEFNIDASVYAEQVTEVGKISELSQTHHYSQNQNHDFVTLKAKNDLFPNKSPMSLLDVTSSIVEATHGPCEAEGLALNTIKQKNKTISSSKSAITGSSNISLEDLQQHCSMTREKAAENLGVSISTLKRACRQHGISSWLHLKRRKKSESPSEPKIMNVTEHDNIAVNPVQDVLFVTIKATYADKMIKFQFPCPSEMVKLEEEVGKMLKLEVGSFSIEYEDEDGDEILLTSSRDLRYCTDTWTSLGKTTIRMLVKLNTS